MTKITCPDCHGKSGRWTTGDGYQEWDDCPLCDPNGDNDTGLTTRRRVAAYRKEQAADEARWDRIIAEEREAEAALDREYGPIINWQ